MMSDLENKPKIGVPNDRVEEVSSKNQIKKRTIFTGLFWLGLFLGVILYARASSSNLPLSTQMSNMFNDVKEMFSNDTDNLRTIISQEVVKEESTTIEVVEKVSPAVVSIVFRTVVFDPFSGPFASEEGIGTGFIIDPNGIIITNSHVVDDVNGEYSVLLNDGTTYEVTDINLDRQTDLAILEINARGLPTIELGDSSEIQVGQTAIAIGNALGQYSNTVTTGVVSGIARDLTASGGFGDVNTYEDAIQTDAALNPGNSGGPLLNSRGQVIGINVATTFGADNISFAIPVNTLKPILQTYFEEGRIIRPFLGVSYTMISSEIAELRDFPEGAFVSRVLPGSAAAEVGIQRGDIIIEFNGNVVNSENSLSKAINTTQAGERVTVVVDRLGRNIEFDVVMGETPESLQ